MTLPTNWQDTVSSVHAADINAWDGQINANTAAIAANAAKVNGITGTNTPSAAGQVPTTTDTTHWTWQTLAGGGGGAAAVGLPLFDSYIDWSTVANGAIPATDAAGKAMVVTYTGVLPTVSGGKLVSNDTGSSAQAIYITTNPNGTNPILYFEGEADLTAGGSTNGGSFDTVLWESALPSGLLGGATDRSPCHIVWLPTGYIYQTYDSGNGLATTVGVVSYAVAPALGAKLPYQVALDPANNRVVIKDPTGAVNTFYTDATAPAAAQNFIKNVAAKYATQEIYLSNPGTDHKGEHQSFRVSCLVNEKFNVVYSKWQRLIDSATASSPMAYCKAPAGNATVDTASIQAAHDALPASGGVIRMQPGIYYMTAAGVSITKRTNVFGVGSSTNDTQGLTVLYSTDPTATAITVSADGCILRDFEVSNGSPTTPTSGVGINMLRAGQSVVENVSFYGYYDNISFVAGNYWRYMGGRNFSPVRYGCRIQNTDHNDSGDMLLGGGLTFDVVGVTRNPTAAVRWETGSGLRIDDVKFNGAGTYKFVTHVDLAFNAASTAVANSADIFIQNSSLEGAVSFAVKAAVVAGAFGLYQVHVQNVEIMACPTAVQIGTGVSNWRVDGLTVLGGTVGVDVLNGAGPGYLGVIHTSGTTTPFQIAAGASKFIHVEPPLITADGVIVTDSSAGAAQITHMYRRAIDFTVNATPAALWTFGVVNKTGGRIRFNVAGTHNAATGFYNELDFAYSVDGSGTVTFYDISTETAGTAIPTLSHSSTANVIVVKLAASDGNNITNGKAELVGSGLFSSVKRGA